MNPDDPRASLFKGAADWSSQPQPRQHDEVPKAATARVTPASVTAASVSDSGDPRNVLFQGTAPDWSVRKQKDDTAAASNPREALFRDTAPDWSRTTQAAKAPPTTP
eukprot:c14371_g1_i1.p2 GENE.c14371_g1_i1~~c14371_g1_i1.p2  ORF type:complete len:119 (-),score=29.06 c14371_g1_i1:281-601(-)